jgi:hypothetical protein
MGFWEGLYSGIAGGQLAGNLNNALDYKRQLARLQYETMLRDWEKQMREKELELKRQEVSSQIELAKQEQALQKQIAEQNMRNQQQQLEIQREELKARQQSLGGGSDKSDENQDTLFSTVIGNRYKMNSEEFFKIYNLYHKYVENASSANLQSVTGEQIPIMSFDEWLNQFVNDRMDVISPQDSSLFLR